MCLMQYELNGVEIDRNRNVGITSIIKNYISLSSDTSLIIHNAGFIPTEYTASRLLSSDGYFNFCVPLILFGFCEDYRRVIVNACHKLILIQAHSDNNCLVEDPTMGNLNYSKYNLTLC